MEVRKGVKATRGIFVVLVLVLVLVIEISLLSRARLICFNDRMNYSVEHLGLPARDTAALKDWYVKTFGGKMIFTDGQTPAAYFVKLPGGITLEIYQANTSLKETADNKLAGWRHIALSVDSIATAKAELETRGVKFTASVGSAGGGGSVLYFEDLEGNLLHLVERPAGSLFKS